MTDKCKNCGEPLMLLAHKDTGKVNPVEIEPSREGNIVVNPERTQYRIATGEEALKNRYREGGPVLFISHFARCPNAKEFRKKK